MLGSISGGFSICLSTCQAIHVGLLLAFPSGESDLVAPASLCLANTAGRSGFPGDAQRSQKAANCEIPQACKSRFDYLFPDILERLFTSCSYQCYCGLNRKLHTNGDGRNVYTTKGGLLGGVREYPRCWLLWSVFSKWPWIFSLLETMATSICSCKIISCLAVSDYISSPNSEVKSLHREEQKWLKSKPDLIVLNHCILKYVMKHGCLLPTEQQAKE